MLNDVSQVADRRDDSFTPSERVLMFRKLLLVATLALLAPGVLPEAAQADTCVVCESLPNPLDPEDVLHQVTGGTGGQHECSGGGGHGTHNCGGDGTGEYWPGDCSTHRSCEDSYAMAVEAMDAFEAGSVQLAVLVKAFGSHIVVDETADKIELFECDGTVARSVSLSTIPVGAVSRRNAG